MASTHKPRRGSLAFKPRKRAKKQTPRQRSWPGSDEVKPLGFVGYKVGMTHIIAKDNRKNSPTSGLEIFVPVTVIDAPPMVIAGFRAYSNGYGGKKTSVDVWTKELSKDLEKRTKPPKKRDHDKGIKGLEKNLDSISDIRLLAHTQPRLTSLAKKVPDMMEIALGGEIQEKLEFAKEHLGKEIKAEEILQENSFADVTAVTKGKGFQGIIKRYGVRRQQRKASKGRRHMGSGGAWKPPYKLWSEPLPGQMGYHTRTELNKGIIRVGNDGKEVTPKGGFLKYGNLKGSYILVKGSVPGPVKRLIRINNPRRPIGEINLEIRHINVESKQGV